MFTGLIQAVGTISATAPKGRGRTLSVDLSALKTLPAVGDSVAVSGVCLTVTSLAGSVATFDAVAETVSRTTLGKLSVGAGVNLEPALRVGEPLGGHIVQGHVDATGKILAIQVSAESRTFRFSLPESIRALVASQGSIAVDGISLTVVAAGPDYFTVAIIPHTLAETTLADRVAGDLVNLEADVLARYAARRAEVSGSGLTQDFLEEKGFA